MGELILMSERMVDRSRPVLGPARFFFALDDPFSYLSAERVERALGPIEWIPVLGPLSDRDAPLSSAERELRARERMRVAEREAALLRLPLVEPHRFPTDSRTAARAAVFAADAGSGAAFALALMRLGFCGGFDITSLSVIEEAAAVAGLEPGRAGAAASDPELDLELDATSRGLRSRGILSPPAISIGSNWFDGREAVGAARSLIAGRPQLGAPLPAS